MIRSTVAPQLPLGSDILGRRLRSRGVPAGTLGVAE